MKSIFFCNRYNLINCLYQIIVLVAVFEFSITGYCCGQFIKPSSLVARKIIPHHFSNNTEPRNAFIKFAGVPLAATFSHVPPVYFMPPLFHIGQKVSLTIPFTRYLFAEGGQLVSSKSPNQSANNSGGNQSANINVWIKFFQDAIKVFCCGASGGVISAAIIQLARFLYIKRLP